MQALADLLTLQFAQRAAIALALTVVTALLIWALVRVGLILRTKVGAAIGTWVSHHRLSRFLRHHAQTPALLADGALRLLGTLLILLLVYEWLVLVLNQFALTVSWADHLNIALFAALSVVANAIVEAMPNVFVVAVIALITAMLAKTSNAFFQLIERGQVRFEKLDVEAARATRKLVTFGLWLFALVMAYPYLPGAQTDAFKGITVLLGVMVSLGSSSVVAQAFSGLILIYARALRPGEYVKIGESEGTVLEIGLFATHIETGSGERVVLPNSQVVATATRNYSRPAPGGKFLVTAEVSIGYNTPWRQVHALLIVAASRTAGVVQEPAPYVLQMALGDFYVQYRLVAFSDIAQPGKRAELQSRLLGHIQDAFNEYGVQIMSPHYLADPQTPHLVPQKDWYTAPAEAPKNS